MEREEAIKEMREKLPWLTEDTKRLVETLIPELKESEDERIRKQIRDFLIDMECKKEWIDYMEKQKEQKPAEWSDNDDQLIGFIFDLLNDLVWRKDWAMNKEECLERLKSLRHHRKPNIELIQRSWYMEGYHDREFGKEPKWILKTGEGGPKHELNPKYGQPLTEQQATEEQLHNLNEAIKFLRMDGCEKIADSLHSLYIILKTQRTNPTEWSEEDEETIDGAYCWLCEYAGSLIQRNYGKSSMLYGIANKLKSLRPSWKPSEEQMDVLNKMTLGSFLGSGQYDILRTLYEQLKNL